MIDQLAKLMAMRKMGGAMKNIGRSAPSPQKQVLPFKEQSPLSQMSSRQTVMPSMGQQIKPDSVDKQAIFNKQIAEHLAQNKPDLNTPAQNLTPEQMANLSQVGGHLQNPQGNDYSKQIHILPARPPAKNVPQDMLATTQATEQFVPSNSQSSRQVGIPEKQNRFGDLKARLM